MKAKEIRDLKNEEIQQRIDEEREALLKARFQHAVGTLQHSSLMRDKRRLIARLKTILAERNSA